jgi:NAD(P)-dependent dehydrogenase (short-subunit alcohol dehydrogenase family)
VLLEKKVAIIAGGARGMGGAIALKFADEGCSCVIADVLDGPGAKTVTEVKKKGRDAIFVHCDVSDSRQVKDMVKQAIAKFKKIDILVVSAGIGTNPTPLEAITDESWDRVMDINSKGTFLCIQALAPHMKQNKSGNIICIVSVAGTVGSMINWHYHASKAAQLSVARSAAATLAPFDIRVNIIHPGMIFTDMSAVFSGPGVKDVLAQQTAMAQHGIPLRRIGSTEDIAKAALFLASDMSSYITGDSIFVSGGSGLMDSSGPRHEVEPKK